MSFSFRVATVLFSLFLHGSIVLVGAICTGSGVPHEANLYYVSLAAFAPVSPGVPLQKTMPGAERDVLPALAEPTSKTEPTPVPPTPTIVPVPSPTKSQLRTHPNPERTRSKPADSKLKQTVSHSMQTNMTQTAEQQSTGHGHRGGAPGMVGGMNVYTEDTVDQRPSISRKAMPEYPENARRRHIQGEVIVRVLVDMSGDPQQCVILSSIPEGVFDGAALAAARKTRFIPGKVKGQPVNTIVLIPYKFALH